MERQGQTRLDPAQGAREFAGTLLHAPAWAGLPLSRALIARALPARCLPARPPPTLSESQLRAGMQGALCGRRAGDPLRVFAHGALMWDQRMAAGAEATPARLRGFARRWCLRDIHDRGMPDAPGLAPGLEPMPDACCEGLLLTLSEAAALWPVWRQEMAPGFCRAAWVTVVPMPQGTPLRALAFVADPTHRLHAGALPEPAQARILARAVGPRGPNADALLWAQEALGAAGLEDALLDRLCGQVGRLLAG